MQLFIVWGTESFQIIAHNPKLLIDFLCLSQFRSSLLIFHCETALDVTCTHA